MTVLATSTFLALLALIALVGVALTWILAATDVAGVRPGALNAARSMIGPRSALWLAAAVATTATAGSLYFSEVAKFVPCTLCWFQRIAMYPLVILLAIAAWRDDVAVRRYVLPLAGIGTVISAWHIAVERLPGLPSGACSTAAPCDVIWVQPFGFMTIPVMALAGFLAIGTLLAVFAVPCRASPASCSSTAAAGSSSA